MAFERPPQTRIFAPDLFSDQVIFITGGGTGMGLELSRGLVSLGANVVIGSRDPEHHKEFLEFAEISTRKIQNMKFLSQILQDVLKFC